MTEFKALLEQAEALIVTAMGLLDTEAHSCPHCSLEVRRSITQYHLWTSLKSIVGKLQRFRTRV